MKLEISIFKGEGGTYIAERSAIPGCVSQDRKTEANISVAIRECLAMGAELGPPLTATTRVIEVAV